MNQKPWAERKDTHDYFDDVLIQNFLRQHNTGSNNLGRRYLANRIENYDMPTVLDIACGSAVNYETFKLTGAACKYTGADRTQKLLDEARRRYGDEIELVNAFAQELPFEDSSKDIVIMRHILEHLHPDEWEQCVREAVRVGKDKLFIVFFLGLSDNDEHKIEHNGPFRS
jgi:ubiquinone/menaquinone biosynthesis C-methylase UbiE